MGGSEDSNKEAYAATEKICDALSILLGALTYIPLFVDGVDYSHTFGRSFGPSLLRISSVMYALMHLFIFVVSSTRFLLDGHRRKRMGVFGVAHALANLAAIMLSYYPLLQTVEPWKNFTDSFDGVLVRKAQGACILASAAGSASLLWMVPRVDKKMSRFFACATLTTATIGLMVLYILYPQTGPFLMLMGFVSSFFNTINFIDVWSSFVLLQFNRYFKKKNSTKRGGRLQSRSSARQYPVGSRFFWRSFRKTDFLLHLFPPKDASGREKMKSAFNLKSEHPALKPSISWLVYTLGETGTTISYLYCGVFGIDDGICYNDIHLVSVVFNFYASVTFLVTLALKGTVSKSQFRALLAYNILATSFMNLWSVTDFVDKGKFPAFLWIVLGQSFVGFAAMAVSFVLSEKEKMPCD